MYEVTIRVDSPISFCADKRRHVLAHLAETYVGRCFLGAYVVRVLEDRLVVSHCRILQTNNTGAGEVDVRFEAEVVTAQRGDILVGVRVLKTDHLIVGVYNPGPEPEGDWRRGGERAREEAALGAKEAGPRRGDPLAPEIVVAFNPHQEGLDHVYAVGQLVPARLTLTQHPPMAAQINVTGHLLTAVQEAPVFRLRGALAEGPREGRPARGRRRPPSPLAPLAALLAEAERELAARTESALFFETLLHFWRAPRGAPVPEPEAVEAWPGGPVWRGPPGRGPPVPGTVSVLALVRRALAGEAVPVGGLWCRPPGLYRSAPLARFDPGEGPPEGGPAGEGLSGEGGPPGTGGTEPPVDAEPVVAFTVFLTEIVDFLRATRELGECYPRPEEFKWLWRAMQSGQTPLPAGWAGGAGAGAAGGGAAGGGAGAAGGGAGAAGGGAGAAF